MLHQAIVIHGEYLKDVIRPTLFHAASNSCKLMVGFIKWKPPPLNVVKLNCDVAFITMLSYAMVGDSKYYRVMKNPLVSLLDPRLSLESFELDPLPSFEKKQRTERNGRL